jgi:hypothetical protein
MPPVPIQNAVKRSAPAEIPGECFNLFRRAQRLCGDSLEFCLPGLPGNYLRATDQEWRVWNRRLRADLMSWHGFRVTARSGLAEPVPCELSIHHPYSRTIVHRVHDATTTHLRKLMQQHAPAEGGQVLAWPGRRASRTADHPR